MDISIFTDQTKTPDMTDLKIQLGQSFEYWMQLKDFIISKYPAAIEEWNYPGKKYGWSFRMKDKKRVIMYFLPREKYFKTAFVFGQKAFELIMDSQIQEEIKNDLNTARVYAEGRGIRIDIKSDRILSDIKKLIEIKLNF